VSQRRQAAQKQASVHDEELTRLRGVRNDLEPVVTKLVAEEHELDVARERYATQFGQLSQKVSDELGMQPEALVETYGPEQPVPELSEQGEPILKDQVESADTADTTEESDEDSFRDFDVTELDDLDRYRTVSYVRSEQEKRLKKAEADLARLGKVNPLATEEFDALQERHTYLNEQRNDVAKSRDDLMGIVKDLDVTMQRVFKEAFDDVSAAFEKIFAVLFPGGHGRLRLENENDLLNTGVLVEASPAGKKVRQLTLLSGGEKSLTALALLLAIFTARPSPFYVMDEVEAALDDLNLTRLLEALKQLREHAQLIIITHQQRTMALADALYGITMRSDGVTAVISQKVER
jgi:chromosome segregation protein